MKENIDIHQELNIKRKNKNTIFITLDKLKILLILLKIHSIDMKLDNDA